MINRRTFITAGAGLGAGLALPWNGRARGAGSLPFVLVVYASGGWDPTMVFDDRLDSPLVARESGAYKAKGAGGIPFIGHAARPAVKTFFDTYGGDAAIVNGVNVGSMDRRGALRNAWGFTPALKARPTDWLSYFAASLNPVLDMPHVVLDAPYMPGDYGSVTVRVGRRTHGEYLDAIGGTETLGVPGETALKAFRSSAYKAMQADVNTQSLDGEKLRALFYGHAREPLVTKRLREADEALGEQGSDSDFLRDGKVAIELFAEGASQCASVQAGRTDLWDTQRDHFAAQSVLYESLFRDLNAILAYADERDILSRMLVVVMSERGRAPRLSTAGGKGPWPVTSVLLWGLGINGGSVVDASDDALRAVPINPVFGTAGSQGAVPLSMTNVFAAIYLLFNAPYQMVIKDVQPLTPIVKAGS